MTTAAVCGPTEKGRAALAECRRILGGESEPMAANWRDMPEAERRFWLEASRQPARHAYQSDWSKVPGDVRCKLKNNLYRAARRASVLLGEGV